VPGEDDRNLFQLLGLPPDAEMSLVRYTYEQHVADATRRNDWSRAAKLSAAFDALD